MYDDGTLFIGRFSEKTGVKIPEGYGKILHSGGEIYKGEISQARISGYGSFVNYHSAEYSGQWKDETQNGYGIEVYNDDSKFTGLFDMGLKVLGIYSWSDGSYYEGEFNDNNFNGYVRIF